MAKKTPLTRDEHVDMGRTLAGIHSELTRRLVQLEWAYSRTGRDGEAVRKVSAAVRALDEARSALDSVVCREYSDDGATAVYYPPREDRAVVGRPVTEPDATPLL